MILIYDHLINRHLIFLFPFPLTNFFGRLRGGTAPSLASPPSHALSRMPSGIAPWPHCRRWPGGPWRPASPSPGTGGNSSFYTHDLDRLGRGRAEMTNQIYDSGSQPPPLLLILGLAPLPAPVPILGVLPGGARGAGAARGMPRVRPDPSPPPMGRCLLHGNGGVSWGPPPRSPCGSLRSFHGYPNPPPLFVTA